MPCIIINMCGLLLVRFPLHACTDLIAICEGPHSTAGRFMHGPTVPVERHGQGVFSTVQK